MQLSKTAKSTRLFFRFGFRNESDALFQSRNDLVPFTLIINQSIFLRALVPNEASGPFVPPHERLLPVIVPLPSRTLTRGLRCYNPLLGLRRGDICALDRRETGVVRVWVLRFYPGSVRLLARQPRHHPAQILLQPNLRLVHADQPLPSAPDFTPVTDASGSELALILLGLRVPVFAPPRLSSV